MSDKTVIDNGTLRIFDGGATRDTAEDKHDLEGFLSPLALQVYCTYMHKHRRQSDGKMRDSDNWQGGFGLSTVMKSAWRHLRDWWTLHRGYPVTEKGKPVEIQDAICGVIFNAFCYLHEMEVAKLEEAGELTPNPSVANFVRANGPQSFHGNCLGCDSCMLDNENIPKAAGETS
jgi:hypothetical protein